MASNMCGVNDIKEKFCRTIKLNIFRLIKKKNQIKLKLKENKSIYSIGGRLHQLKRKLIIKIKELNFLNHSN